MYVWYKEFVSDDLQAMLKKINSHQLNLHILDCANCEFNFTSGGRNEIINIKTYMV